jgi:UDP-N-acetylmuramoyl-L-alanyl-D-glutamate--2,6-diaminopimelate ligase
MAELSTLVGTLGGELIAPAAGSIPVDVRRVRLDSRQVERGDLFAALEGSRESGARYVREALERGASAILCARAPEGVLPVPVWLHREARAVAGRAAAELLGRPSHGMFVVAVTGTNGKTTTAHLAAQLMRACGKKSGVLGTSGHSLADGARIGASHTTPDAPSLQELLFRHRALGGDALALEASSHALSQDRLAGLEVSVAVFTNLTRDHLDYHGDMEAYGWAKQRLFAGLESRAAAVVRADDPWSERMAAAARERGARVFTYSTRSPADLVASDVEIGSEGTRVTLHGMGIHRIRVNLPLLGRFNVENALAAAASVLVGGASPSTIVEGLASVSPAPGRLERVALGAPFEVLVDYAHTPDALEKVLTALRECSARSRPHARLIVLFGCGGERDSGKRPVMGALAGRLADLVILTSDNPRSEDPAAIAAAVRSGLQGANAAWLEELDRARAIARALELARPGDLVLLAGKGHEDTQEIAGVRTAFDDRQVARQAWASRGGVR